MSQPPKPTDVSHPGVLSWELVLWDSQDGTKAWRAKVPSIPPVSEENSLVAYVLESGRHITLSKKGHHLHLPVMLLQEIIAQADRVATNRP